MSELSRLLSPKSIAFIGGTECHVAITRTRELGFPGKIWAVNPKREQLGGIATVKSVADIDGTPDVAFVAVKREPTVDIVRELNAKGCGSAVIYASGFSETGDVGRELQRQLLEAGSGMPLIGPNCYGLVNALARAAIWPDEHGLKPLDKGVAIITQSGNIAMNFTMTRRALPVACVFTLGNQADVDIARMLAALAEDDRITAIGLHIEGLKDIPAFSRAAAFARDRKKPVIALKTGKSEQGAKVTMSHTSSLAGADSLYDALFARYGIARMSSVTSFVETLKFLHHGGPLPGKRLVSMSCSGGEAALIADIALDHDVEFPPFDAATGKRIAATLNEYVAIENPLDYHTFIWGMEDKLKATFTAALSGGVDAGMLILDTPTHENMDVEAWFVTAQAMSHAAKVNKVRGAVVASLPENMPHHLADRLAGEGVAPMLGFDDALSAFAAAASIGRNWAQDEKPPVIAASAASAGEARTLTEYEAKQLLKTFGLSIPEGIVCKPADAVKAAEKLGYPVTLKVSSEAIAHKTEAGGVALNLKTAEEVRAAAAHMAKLGDEVIVERMVTGAVAELIIGLKSDPQFGLALVIGAGGILTELLKDSATLLLPTNRAEIERALSSLKVAKLIDGFRGKSGDRAGVIAAIEAVARFAAAYSERIEELDVNPLLVLPPGKGAIAVDALIHMRKD
jgi:acetate---CoA ligase (ADP-forming)